MIMCKVYTDIGGINDFPAVREILQALKLVVYRHVQADKPLVSVSVSVRTYGKRMVRNYLYCIFFDKMISSTTMLQIHV